MYNKSDYQFLVIQATIDDNRQASDDKMNSKLDKQDYTLDKLMAMVKNMTDKNQNSNSLPENMDSPKAPDPTTAVPANNKAPPLEGGYSKKIGGMWTLKHEISSQKFYELLIKAELKCDTSLDLNDFFKKNQDVSQCGD